MVVLRPTLGTNTTHACTFPADTYDFTKCCECIFVYIYYMRNIGYGGAKTNAWHYSITCTHKTVDTYDSEVSMRSASMLMVFFIALDMVHGARSDQYLPRAPHTFQSAVGVFVEHLIYNYIWWCYIRPINICHQHMHTFTVKYIYILHDVSEVLWVCLYSMYDGFKANICH